MSPEFPDPLTERVLAAIFEVANTLGVGFLEKIYERALLKELELRNIQATPQPELKVFHKGHHLGTFSPDILVENDLLIELKCADRLTPDHIAQCLNYLKASQKSRCLLVNFQKSKVEWRRIENRLELLSL
jgi:GxxExxY protein